MRKVHIVLRAGSHFSDLVEGVPKEFVQGCVKVDNLRSDWAVVLGL